MDPQPYRSPYRLPYRLIESQTSPLVIDSPHSGRFYPADLDFACPMPVLRRDEDAYVDELLLDAAQAPVAATLLCAHYPRSLLDLNRAEDDLDPSAFVGALEFMARPDPATFQGYGLIRRLCREGVAIYRAPLAADEARRRIETIYRPYHQRLSDLLAARRARFGEAFLIDMHSMPNGNDHGVARPDFVLGDRDGTSCARELTVAARDALEALGYRVAVNAPYKGREIVRRHGLGSDGEGGGVGGGGAHALQIEINRRLYLDEARVEKTAHFDRLRRDLTTFFARLSDWTASRADQRAAAE